MCLWMFSDGFGIIEFLVVLNIWFRLWYFGYVLVGVFGENVFDFSNVFFGG